jgi:hypothetical protein
VKKKLSLLPAILILGLLSCEKNTITNREAWKLVQGEDLLLNLDHRTAPNENYYQYVENFHGSESMVFHVRKDHSFKIYDLQSGQLKEEINYPVNGPGALPSVYGFYIHNEDSIFLSQQYHYRVLLTNGNLEVVDQLNLIPEGIKFKSSGYLPEESHTVQSTNFSSRSLPFINNGNFIFPSLYVGYADRTDYTIKGRIYTDYDLSNKEFHYRLPFPKSMQEKLWGGMLILNYGCYNPKTEKIVTSYSGFEYISVTSPSFNDTVKYFKATSEKFQEIRPAPKPYEVVEEEIDHYMNVPTFGGIYYDKFRDVYYRIGKFPKPEGYDGFKSDYLDPMANPRDWAIIVLDKDFKKLTEYTLKQPKEGVYFENCFVNKYGFYVAYVDYSNEDKLVFKGFVLEENQN